jgi:hypothetical protein
VVGSIVGVDRSILGVDASIVGMDESIVEKDELFLHLRAEFSAPIGF